MLKNGMSFWFVTLSALFCGTIIVHTNSVSSVLGIIASVRFVGKLVSTYKLSEKQELNSKIFFR